MKNQKHDILIIGPMPPPKGGVSIHIKRFCKKLYDHGIEHDILDESRIKKNGIDNIHKIRMWKYLGLLRGRKLVHIHSSNHFVRLLHTITARLFGANVIHTVHSARGGYLAMASLRLACRLAHFRIGVSNAVSQAIGNKAKTIPAFIPPTTDDEIIKGEISLWIERQKLQGKRVIAFNAYNTSMINGIGLYGIDMIVKAFENDYIRNMFAAIVCISSLEPYLEYYAEIENIVKKNNLRNCIKIIIGDNNFAGILKRCDIFVRPTITDGDAISIREALWYGVPVLASDAVARPARVKTFPNRDQQAFENAMISVIAQPPPPPYRKDFSDDVIDIYKKFLLKK